MVPWSTWQKCEQIEFGPEDHCGKEAVFLDDTHGSYLSKPIAVCSMQQPRVAGLRHPLWYALETSVLDRCPAADLAAATPHGCLPQYRAADDRSFVLSRHSRLTALLRRIVQPSCHADIFRRSVVRRAVARLQLQHRATSGRSGVLLFGTTSRSAMSLRESRANGGPKYPWVLNTMEQEGYDLWRSKHPPGHLPSPSELVDLALCVNSAIAFLGSSGEIAELLKRLLRKLSCHELSRNRDREHEIVQQATLLLFKPPQVNIAGSDDTAEAVATDELAPASASSSTLHRVRPRGEPEVRHRPRDATTGTRSSHEPHVDDHALTSSSPRGRVGQVLNKLEPAHNASPSMRDPRLRSNSSTASLGNHQPPASEPTFSRHSEVTGNPAADSYSHPSIFRHQSRDLTDVAVRDRESDLAFLTAKIRYGQVQLNTHWPRWVRLNEELAKLEEQLAAMRVNGVNDASLLQPLPESGLQRPHPTLVHHPDPSKHLVGKCRREWYTYASFSGFAMRFLKGLSFSFPSLYGCYQADLWVSPIVYAEDTTTGNVAHDSLVVRYCGLVSCMDLYCPLKLS
nr:hypothetical protein CFP56_69052 [Quercus suber]